MVNVLYIWDKSFSYHKCPKIITGKKGTVLINSPTHQCSSHSVYNLTSCVAIGQRKFTILIQKESVDFPCAVRCRVPPNFSLERETVKYQNATYQ